MDMTKKSLGLITFLVPTFRVNIQFTTMVLQKIN